MKAVITIEIENIDDLDIFQNSGVPEIKDKLIDTLDELESLCGFESLKIEIK
jgi:hypothetical protein